MFFRMIRVFVLLLPVSLALRKDRKKWIKKEYGPEYTLKAQKNARKLMNTLVSLGPAYIKLGQWLSARADILPQPYMAELAKLQDEVPPAPYEQIDKIIRNDLGQSYEKFEHIDSDASGALTSDAVSCLTWTSLPCTDGWKRGGYQGKTTRNRKNNQTRRCHIKDHISNIRFDHPLFLQKYAFQFVDRA